MKEVLVYLCFVSSSVLDRNGILSVQLFENSFSPKFYNDLIWKNDILEDSKLLAFRKLLTQREPQYVFLLGQDGNCFYQMLENRPSLDLEPVPLERCFNQVHKQQEMVQFSPVPVSMNSGGGPLSADNARNLLTLREKNKSCLLDLIQKNTDDLKFLTDTNDVSRQIILPL